MSTLGIPSVFIKIPGDMKRRETPAKKKILDIFLTSDIALNSPMLEAALNNQVDRSTVYRILQSFEKDGRIHKIVDSNGKIFYAACKNCSSESHFHNHFHFKCNQCNQIECLDQKVPQPDKKGYVFKEFYGLIDGVCATCA